MSDPMLMATSQGGATETNPATQAAQGESTQTTTQSQAQKPAWMAQLPKDLLDDADLSQFDKLEKLARTFKDQGGKLKELEAKAVIPGKESKPEDWDKFYASLGRPEKPDGYQFTRDGDFKDVPKLPGLDEWTADTYHKLGLTKAQAEALWQENAKKTLEIGAQVKAQNEAKRTEAVKALEGRWGREYQSKRADFEKAVNVYFGDSMAKDLLNSPLANNADFIDRLAGLNRYMSDAPFRSGNPANPGKSAADLIFAK